jgi:hypothetical protein
MSNAVAIPVPSTALADRLRTTVAPDVPGDSSGKVFLRFDFQTGKWTAGKEQEDVTDIECLVNTASIGHGWTMWVAGTPKKAIVPFDQPMPQAMQPEGQVYPQEARVLAGAFADGSGEFVFETNSLGGRNGVDQVIKQVIIRAQQGHETFLYPVVELSSSSYTHKTHGRVIHTPVFKILEWADINGVREGQGMIAGTVEPEEEEYEDEPAPVTRRRRSV